MLLIMMVAILFVFRQQRMICSSNTLLPVITISLKKGVLLPAEEDQEAISTK
jgi:hypothetical protein